MILIVVQHWDKLQQDVKINRAEAAIPSSLCIRFAFQLYSDLVEWPDYHTKYEDKEKLSGQMSQQLFRLMRQRCSRTQHRRDCLVNCSGF